jgi:hypothetical protein
VQEETEPAAEYPEAGGSIVRHDDGKSESPRRVLQRVVENSTARELEAFSDFHSNLLEEPSVQVIQQKRETRCEIWREASHLNVETYRQYCCRSRLSGKE